MLIQNLGTFFYPSNVLIHYLSNDPNLSVRLFLIHNIKKVNDYYVDNLDNNVYSSFGLIADQIDGSANKYTEPLILPRQNNLDLEFRGQNKTFVYARYLEEMKVGDYLYKIEVRSADEFEFINGKKQRKPGVLLDQIYGSFKIEYSPIDRLFCVDKNYLTIAEMIKTIYTNATSNWVYAGARENCSDLVLTTPNLEIGTRFKLTPIKLEGDQENLGIAIESTVGILPNNQKGAVFKRLQHGEYNMEIKGNNTIYKIIHKADPLC